MKGPLKSIPIVGITAGAMEDEINACLEAGMNTVLTKPVDAHDLRATLIRFAVAEQELLPLTTEKPVLVVDDVSVNLQVAEKQLAKLGIPCETVDKPEKALKMLKAGGYALAIVDINMPGLDGVALTKRLRKAQKKSGTHTPVVAMTGVVSIEDRKRFLDAGMDGYLAKPVVLGDLAAELSKWLSAPGAEAAAAGYDGKGDMDNRETSAEAVDLALLGEILGEDDEAEKVDWVGHFIDAFPPYLDDLDAAISGENRTATRDAAHAAKSAANSAAALALAGELERLETAAPSGAWDSIGSTAQSVRSEFERVVEFLNDARQNG